MRPGSGPKNRGKHTKKGTAGRSLEPFCCGKIVFRSTDESVLISVIMEYITERDQIHWGTFNAKPLSSPHASLFKNQERAGGWGCAVQMLQRLPPCDLVAATPSRCIDYIHNGVFFPLTVTERRGHADNCEICGICHFKYGNLAFWWKKKQGNAQR